MKFSVIIPVYNALEDVKLCLESIIKNYDFSNSEVIVIDDLSKEDTANFLKEFSVKHPEFKVDKNEENLGFVKTCNKGMKMAQGEIVILLNSDTIVPKFFQEKISDCFNSDEKIGVASPIASKSWLYKIPLPKSYSIEKMNKLLREKHTPKYPIIPSAEGFCFCIRKEVIDEIGYLDEAYGKGYHEEVDFSYRSIKNGWKNVLIDDLYVYHRDSASFGKRKNQLTKQNNKIFREKWAGFREEFIIKNNFENPVYHIKKELFPIKTFVQRLIFDKTKIGDTKTVKILGLKVLKKKIYVVR